jgi:hypothetical protein
MENNKKTTPGILSLAFVIFILACAFVIVNNSWHGRPSHVKFSLLGIDFEMLAKRDSEENPYRLTGDYLHNNADVEAAMPYYPQAAPADAPMPLSPAPVAPAQQ